MARLDAKRIHQHRPKPLPALPTDYTLLSTTQRRAVREEYTRRQDGKCSHCGEPLEGRPSDEVEALELDMRRFPDGFFNNPIHLHHCHRSGMTIGSVHAWCNAVLWQYHGE